MLCIIHVCYVMYLNIRTGSCEGRLTGTGPPLTLDYCYTMMSDLETKYPVEYTVYNLSSVAVAIVFPLMKKTS